MTNRTVILTCALLSCLASRVSADSPDESFIVGGDDATPGAWPWQVQIAFASIPQVCGGSLLNDSWVVTAKHCVEGEDPADFTLSFGVHTRSLAASDPNVQVRHIAAVRLHPTADVALLQLDTPVTYTRFVQPISLVSSTVSPGAVGYVTGWGRTGWTDPAADVLQQGLAPIVSLADCRLRLPGVTSEFVCAGYADGSTGGCKGDSGGPLVVTTSTFSSGWKLAGIVSWGARGCVTYVAYVDVARVRSWIIGHTGPTGLIGDVDGDGCVKTPDYDLIIANYGKNAGTATNPAADIDGNGLVGYNDYLLLLQNWGDGC